MVLGEAEARVAKAEELSEAEAKDVGANVRIANAEAKVVEVEARA